MALFLVFPTLAAALAFSDAACVQYKCDVNTIHWWPVVVDQTVGSTKAAVVISDQLGMFGQDRLPATAITALKTSAQLTSSGWTWQTFAGNPLIPQLSRADPVPNLPAFQQTIPITGVAPLP